MDQANKPRKVTQTTLAPTTPYEVASLPITTIDLDKQQLRHQPHDDDIEELAADIARRGLLQPIGVRPLPAGRWQLLWGSRRLAAHRNLRRTHILAHVYPHNDDPVKAVALVENLQRRQMTLEEECDAVTHLHTEERKSPDQISDLLGKSRAWVLRRLSVPGLPLDLREPLLSGDLSLGAAEALAQIEDDGLRAYATQQARSTKASITDVRALVEALTSDPSITDAINQGIQARQTPQAPARIMMPCAACDTPRDLEDLILIRVCRDGCTTPHHTAQPDADDKEA